MNRILERLRDATRELYAIVNDTQICWRLVSETTDGSVVNSRIVVSSFELGESFFIKCEVLVQMSAQSLMEILLHFCRRNRSLLMEPGESWKLLRRIYTADGREVRLIRQSLDRWRPFISLEFLHIEGVSFHEKTNDIAIVWAGVPPEEWGTFEVKRPRTKRCYTETVAFHIRHLHPGLARMTFVQKVRRMEDVLFTIPKSVGVLFASKYILNWMPRMMRMLNTMSKDEILIAKDEQYPIEDDETTKLSLSVEASMLQEIVLSDPSIQFCLQEDADCLSAPSPFHSSNDPPPNRPNTADEDVSPPQKRAAIGPPPPNVLHAPATVSGGRSYAPEQVSHPFGRSQSLSSALVSQRPSPSLESPSSSSSSTSKKRCVKSPSGSLSRPFVNPYPSPPIATPPVSENFPTAPLMMPRQNLWDHDPPVPQTFQQYAMANGQGSLPVQPRSRDSSVASTPAPAPPVFQPLYRPQLPLPLPPPPPPHPHPFPPPNSLRSPHQLTSTPLQPSYSPHISSSQAPMAIISRPKSNPLPSPRPPALIRTPPPVSRPESRPNLPASQVQPLPLFVDAASGLNRWSHILQVARSFFAGQRSSAAAFKAAADAESDEASGSERGVRSPIQLQPSSTKHADVSSLPGQVHRSENSSGI